MLLLSTLEKDAKEILEEAKKPRIMWAIFRFQSRDFLLEISFPDGGQAK